MANYATLISAIQEVITANGNNEITGPILQQTLVSIINSLGFGYQYVGIAEPETVPGTPDQNVFYIAGPGTYPNFGPAVVGGSQIGIFKYNGTWNISYLTFPVADGSVTTPKLADRSVTISKLADDVMEILNTLHLIDKDNLDFAISDAFGYQIVRFANGHIYTKNFDSSVVPTRTEMQDAQPIVVDNDQISDLSISDENGYQIVKFQRGHIITKEFNSEDINIAIRDDAQCDFAIGDGTKQIVQFKNGHIITKKFNSESISDAVNYSSIYQRQGNPFGFESAKYFRRSAIRKDFAGYMPLIIVAGQSNADGRIPYTNAPAWLSANNYAINNYMVWDTATLTFKTYNVLGMTGNGGAIAGSDGTGENKFAFDAYFAHSFLAQYGGSLYMIRQTLGGIGIQNQPTTGTRNWTWQPDIASIVPGCNSMCLALMEKIQAAYEFAKGQNLKLLPIAILWHQGENDATADRIGYFKQNLSNLITWIRGLFLAPTLPFINADINNADTYTAQVNAIFRELNDLDEYMKTIDMSGHSTTMDGVHFDVSAIQYMGEQMFNAYQNYI